MNPSIDSNGKTAGLSCPDTCRPSFLDQICLDNISKFQEADQANALSELISTIAERVCTFCIALVEAEGEMLPFEKAIRRAGWPNIVCRNNVLQMYFKTFVFNGSRIN